MRYFQAGSFTGKETFDYSDSNIVYHSIVARCGFDGQQLKYKEHGTELTLSKDESHKLAKRRGVQVSGRGLYEPSLTRFKGKYYMTLRSDHSAFVTKGTDGIHLRRPESGPLMTDNGWAVTVLNSIGSLSVVDCFWSTPVRLPTTITFFAIAHHCSLLRLTRTTCTLSGLQNVLCFLKIMRH